MVNMIDNLKIEHFYMLNNRMRAVEEEIIAKVQRISMHLAKSISEGMEEYRTFIIDGIMLIEPCGDDIPLEVSEKFLNLPRNTVLSATENYYGESLQDSINHTRNFDFDYYNHPTEYPSNYSPMTRSWDHIILEALAHNQITEEDLMFVRTEDILPHIVINI